MIRPDFTPNALRRSLGLGFRPLGSLRPSYRTPHSAHGALVNYSEKGSALSSQTRKAAGTWEDQETPGPPPRDPGPDFRFPAEFGRETGNFPIPIPGRIPKVPGLIETNGGFPYSRFRSDEHQLQWARNRLSREYHASALTACGSFSGSERGKMQLPSTSRDCAMLQRKSDPASGSAWH